jgi:hypothetical protein
MSTMARNLLQEMMKPEETKETKKHKIQELRRVEHDEFDGTNYFSL